MCDLGGVRRVVNARPAHPEVDVPPREAKPQPQAPQPEPQPQTQPAPELVPVRA